MILLQNCALCYDEDSKIFSISDNDNDNEFVMRFPLKSFVEIHLPYAREFQEKSNYSLLVDYDGHLKDYRD